MCVSRLKFSHHRLKQGLLCSPLPFTHQCSLCKESSGTDGRSFESVTTECVPFLSPVWREARLQKILTASAHSITSGNADLQLGQEGPLHCLLRPSCRVGNKMQIICLEITRGVGLLNPARCRITEREASESARPAAINHQLSISCNPHACLFYEIPF